MLSFYNGDKPGGTPGLLPEPYYWWEAGSMMGSLVEYWKYTGDDSFVNLTKQALLFQVGDHNDYMPINQTRTEGNDDQGFWGLAVMSAAEYNFPHPDADQPQWLALAQAVFNTQAARWDDQHCGGGLRWQIFQWNNGYNYKNSISQACFFALGARLALFTGNETYAKWADKTWDWMIDIEFINTKNWAVYDGAHIETGCTNIVPYQFSYNVGGMILGAAAMYNYTESEQWKTRLDNLLEGVKVFFTGPNKNIMTEVACEPVNLCNLDQQSFKAYLSRWLAVTTQWAPHTYDMLMPLLQTSAVAAAKQCQGGDNKRMCGLVWNKDKYDGSTGVGQQMAAMEVTLSCMVKQRSAPLTSDTGGTSKGDPDAGSEDIGRTEPESNLGPITAGDRAGAGILTVLIIGLFVSSLIWIFIDETSDKSTVNQFRDFSSAATTTAALAAAGGGVAAILHRKKESDYENEKVAAVVHSSEDDSSRDSADKHIAVPSSVLVSNVRNQDPMPARRVSSMPIGWAQNRAMRQSDSFGSESVFAAYDRQSRADLARDREVLNATPVTAFGGDGTSSPRHSQTLQAALASEITRPTDVRNDMAENGLSTEEVKEAPNHNVEHSTQEPRGIDVPIDASAALLSEKQVEDENRAPNHDTSTPQTPSHNHVEQNTQEFGGRDLPAVATAPPLAIPPFTFPPLAIEEAREETQAPTHDPVVDSTQELGARDVPTTTTPLPTEAVDGETQTLNHPIVEQNTQESGRDPLTEENRVPQKEPEQSVIQSSNDETWPKYTVDGVSEPTTQKQVLKEEEKDTNKEKDVPLDDAPHTKGIEDEHIPTK